MKGLVRRVGRVRWRSGGKKREEKGLGGCKNDGKGEKEEDGSELR